MVLGSRSGRSGLSMRSFQNFAIKASAASKPPSMNTAPTRASQASAKMVARNLGAGFLSHQIGQPARQLALVRLGKRVIKHVGNDQAEYMVAEEFQALVAVGAGGPAGQRGNMRDRALKQSFIGEFIADPILERGSVFVFGLSAHRTIVNNRLQRTDTGQRQNSQARSPS